MIAARAVYFVGGDALIKIGVSKNPRRRLVGLQTDSPSQLRLLAWIPDAGFAGEREMHQRFAADRSHGEWFHPSPELLELIAATAAQNAAEAVRQDVRAKSDVPPLMTSAEVAEMLRVTRDTVCRLARAGVLASSKVGRQRRFRRGEVEAFLPGAETDGEPVEVAS